MTDDDKHAREVPTSGFWLNVKISAFVTVYMAPPALLLLLQIYWYLRDGVWTPMSTLAGLQMITTPSSWSHQPTSWFGVYNVFDSFPLLVPLFVVGVFLAIEANSQRSRGGRGHRA